MSTETFACRAPVQAAYPLSPIGYGNRKRAGKLYSITIMAPTSPRHFSMIRGFHLADLFTLANAACGVAAVFFAMLYVSSGSLPHFFAAAAMAPAAFVFDVLDGRIAR